MTMLKIFPVRAFADNYIWMIRNHRYAAVVDPGDAFPVLRYLHQEKLKLVAILNTHHHHDHVGGNAALLQEFPVPVFGPADESIRTVTQPRRESNPQSEEGIARIPELSVSFSVLDIPGHTAGHIAYYGANMLFCGDTLFACGCGRLFEGTAAQMCDSLRKLAGLPDETQMYCGHEYTRNNIRFSRLVEPGNEALILREKAVEELQKRGAPTLPSTIGAEKDTNPFLRCGQPEIARNAAIHAGVPLSGHVQVFAALRDWKNHFLNLPSTAF
jgi:hydroxyacylglutathione hydrolase